MRTIVTLLLWVLPSVVVNAQDLSTEPEEEIRRYTVEMIVFKYTEDIGGGGELFVRDTPPTDAFGDDTSTEPTSSRPVRTLRLSEVGFTRLARADFIMGDIMDRLQRNRAYQPVMHFGWTQATHPAEVTRDISLSTLTGRSAGFDGSLKLYLSRFLHLVVDLQLDAAANDSVDGSESIEPVQYRIQEDRIFRSGELRYFDHPKFGVLAKITRAEDAEAQSGELLGDAIQ